MVAPNSDSNRLLLSYVKERALGTTPGTPSMQTLRSTGENLNYAIDVSRSEEIRSDRLTPGHLQVGARNNGGANFELSYGTHDDFLESAMFNAWERVGYKTNVTSDSQITNVTDSTDLIATANLSVTTIVLVGTVATVTTGSAHGLYKGQKVNIINADQSEYTGVKVITSVTSDTVFTFTALAGTTTPATGTILVALNATFATGLLIRTTGFTNAANNSLFKISSTTVATNELTEIVLAGTPTLTDETAPPAGATIQVVGFEGIADDIDATSTGLSSTTLDFTTLGLAVGDWLNIGGTAAGEKFTTTANNDWVRISAIAALAMTFDNRPTGWTAEVSSGSKTLQIWMGDRLEVGTTQQSVTIEKSIQSQDDPEYLVYTGMVVNSASFSFESAERVTGTFDFLGTASSVSNVTLDASPTAATTTNIMNAVNNVGRISEGGSVIANGNAITSVEFSINNQLREQTAIGTLGLIGIGSGDSEITGTINTYFADRTLYEKFVNNTDSNLSVNVNRDSQALIFDFLNVTYTESSVEASGRNQDVFVSLGFSAKLNSTIGNQMQIQRFSEYVA